MSEESSEQPAPQHSSDEELIREALKAEVRLLPLKPGVYRFFDHEGHIIYVGKAKALRNRVGSYFTQQAGHSAKTQVMVKLIRRLETTVTATENDALLLEANLIKQHQPRYNVLLKDNKSYPYLHLTTQHDFPRLALYRGDRKEAGRFFGPYPSVHAVRNTLKWLQKIFPVRQCEDTQYNHRTRPCLQYQIHRCGGPCCDRISQEKYGAIVAEVVLFLEGKDKQLVKALQQQMWQLAEARDFEGAGRIRDRIAQIKLIQEKRRLNLTGHVDLDAMSIAVEGGQTVVQLFFVRGGINLGNRAYYPDSRGEEDVSAILQAFINQFYLERPPPTEVLIDRELPEQELLQSALSERLGKRVRLHRPERGEKRSLVAMAAENALQSVRQQQAGQVQNRVLLEALQAEFNMPEQPSRIEIYDNSHIQDSEAVGAMVVFGPEGFIKNQYRKFNLEASGAADDTARMEVVLTRRFKRLKEGDEANWPDLVLLDGGIAQLNTALRVAEELQLSRGDVLFCAIAKGPERNAGREQLFLPDMTEPTILPHNSPLLMFLQRVRDEAHRFVIGYHRQKRGKRQTQSALDAIPGIGPKRKKALLHTFGSVRGVSQASLEEIAKVSGFSMELAQQVLEHLGVEQGSG
uniref:UvrABC system protein C n=1 Tax=Magnetococcus massalia (strain MO-1) TaxID=451514 RepID=A0A1S7LDL2_MAGMO|nr:excinuclease ABC subunit C [Candidatus Magnetococcus massalia]